MLTTLRLFGLYAGIFLISLQGRAQTVARQPSYPLLSAGTSSVKEYLLNHTNSFSHVDLHAFSLSEEYKGMDELSEALCPSEFDEIEKVRSIYFWIAKNIAYDSKALTNNNFSSQVADSVFASKKGVCEGFSNLFVALCRESGIDARTITGYVKDELYDENKILTYPNHVWNAVKINDQWQLLDVTWASFNKNIFEEEEKSINYFRYKLESNFFIDPTVFVQSHLPEDPFWQLLAKPINSESFFSGEFTVDTSVKIDVHKRISDLDVLDSLDREIAYCERMVANPWNKFKEYRLGIAYYYKAQQLYRKVGQLHGRQRERMMESIQLYYDKSLAQLSEVTSMDFGYEYCQDFIRNIKSRKDLLSYNN